LALSKAMPFFKNMIKTLYFMLLKCYHHLHSLSKNVTIDQVVDENCYLNIFEMTTSKNELKSECKKYQMSFSIVGKA
jgi:acetyl-CoA carboxylase beta subunit